MTNDEEKEFADYILEEFQRGVLGQEHRPMFGGHETVAPQVAARALGVLLMPYGLASDIRNVLNKEK